VTILAHNAAVAGLHVDTSRLFDGDRDYAMWVGIVVEKVDATNRQAARSLEM
jgi:hypothetical protein